MPNGEITSTQLRVLGNLIKPYGDEQGVGDITSRANFQLRGITVADSDKVMKAVQECGLSSVMSGAEPHQPLILNLVYISVQMVCRRKKVVCLISCNQWKDKEGVLHLRM